MNAWSVLKDAWLNRDKLGDQHKTQELAAFLPPALEIQESPPNPLAKWLGRSLMLLLVIGIAWACVGEINIVASAEGKIIPSSRVKQIQPLEKGVIKAIHVTEGQRVEKGQPLIELDSTVTGADRSRLAGELSSVQFRKSVSKTFLYLLNTSITTSNHDLRSSPTLLEPPAEANEYDIELNKRLLWQRWEQYESQRKGLQSSLRRTQSEQGVSQEQIKKLQQTLPIITKRRDSMQALQSKNYVSENELLEVEQEFILLVQDLASEKKRHQKYIAAAEEIKQQINVLEAQTRKEQLAEIMAANREIAVLQEELTKASDLDNRQILYAPVSGQIQELAIATVGGVVTEAQQLMLLVPEEEQLEVEVFLENKDIGFVEEGIKSEIKIHTFPFTKYGVIDGQVMTISDDAIVDEKRGLIYSMRVLMEKNTIVVNGREVKLMPGMAVTAEMKTGNRRIIEFFLAPLLKAKSESIRER
ncbi:HlyD family type I secretion periplasmic adaptor subunit [Microbulbifer sp. GL-2]|uniref:HlyD family type I secretion periplasmic adaptor subunit n=1 Tax=Microbulbifer sp. GL-2 TaxID=2591606 RepID=UPI00116541B5|nr:HlyD family type I secretion periplasmic adaptor subunit [Microbulbifer sp. GL-2]BBM04133.1 HlyD family type I secretion periplasmic adaptor subunit [Microbulbifer sp. GL-2]